MKRQIKNILCLAAPGLEVLLLSAAPITPDCHQWERYLLLPSSLQAWCTSTGDRVRVGRAHPIAVPGQNLELLHHTVAELFPFIFQLGQQSCSDPVPAFALWDQASGHSAERLR